MRQNYNHPCIITWSIHQRVLGRSSSKNQCSAAKFYSGRLSSYKSLDPFRPVIVNDGWEHTVSDILTLHDYEEKGTGVFGAVPGPYRRDSVGTLYHNRSRAAFADGFTYRGQSVIISESGGTLYTNMTMDGDMGIKRTQSRNF